MTTPPDLDLENDEEGSPITTSTLLYIDNSNIFISAQKHAAKLNQFREGVQDVRCRMNMRKIIPKALNGRELDHGVVYVSEPKPFTSELEAAFRQAGIDNIKRFRKNIMFKEKEVDTALTADAVEQIVLEREKDDKLLILFTGDRDMKPIVEKAELYGFKIHIWSMPTQLATEYKKRHSCVEIFSMDKFFDEVTFTEKLYKWKDIPKERSFVLTFSSGAQPAGERAKEIAHDEFEKKIVDVCCNLLHLPCQGRFYDDNNFVLVICPQELQYRHGGEQKDIYDVNEVIGASLEEDRPPELFKKMRKKCTHACLEMFDDELVQCTGVQTFVQFCEDRTRREGVENFEISNQYQPLTPLPLHNSGQVINHASKFGRPPPSPTPSPSLSPSPTPSSSSSSSCFSFDCDLFGGKNCTKLYCPEKYVVKKVDTENHTEDEIEQKKQQQQSKLAPFSKKFLQLIFTAVISVKVPKFLQACLVLFALSTATSSPSSCSNPSNSSETLSSSVEKVVKNGKGPKNKKENVKLMEEADEEIIKNSKHINITDDDDLDQNEIDEKSLLDQQIINCAYDPISDDDHGGGFYLEPPTPPPPPARYEVVGRMHLKRRNKSGEHCRYRFKCEKFPICNYAHTREEKTFLNQNSKPETRRLYKTIECRYFGMKGGRCKFQYKPFLCPFAHGTQELVKGVK